MSDLQIPYPENKLGTLILDSIYGTYIRYILVSEKKSEIHMVLRCLLINKNFLNKFYQTFDQF